MNRYFLTILFFLWASLGMAQQTPHAVSADIQYSSEDINALLVTKYRHYSGRHAWEIGLRTVLDHRVRSDQRYFGRGLSGLQDRFGMAGAYTFFPEGRGRSLNPLVYAMTHLHTYKVYHQSPLQNVDNAQLPFPESHHRHYLLQCTVGIGAEILVAPNVHVDARTSVGITPTVVSSAGNFMSLTGNIQLGVSWDIPEKIHPDDS